MTETFFERKLLPAPGGVPPLRAALRRWLRTGAGVAPEELEDILVVTSELVTNGVAHDGGDLITVRVERSVNDVAIEVVTVEPAGGRQPAHGNVVDPIEHGRGLGIVRALSDDLCILISSGRRITRCTVPVEPPSSPTAGEIGAA